MTNLDPIHEHLKQYNPAYQPSGGGGGGGAAPAGATPTGDGAAAAAPAAAAVAAPAADDMQARIAALKSKMEAGKAPAKQAPGAPAAAAKAPAKKPPAGGGRKVWPVEPVNKRTFGDERLYGPFTVNKWFAVSSLLLTVTCLGMWVRDWDRDWRAWQGIARTREIAALEAEVKAQDALIDAAALEAAKQDTVDAEAAVAARQAELERLRDELGSLEGVEYGAKQSYQIAKSSLDAMKYEYEQKYLFQGADADLLQDAKGDLTALTDEVTALKTAWDESMAARTGKDAEIFAVEGSLTDATKLVAELTFERTQVEGRLAKIEPGFFNDWVRNMPLADMLAPTQKIDQIVLEKLTDNYNFMHVGRIDRCTTCHVNIDDPGYAEHDVSAVDGQIGPFVPEGQRLAQVPEALVELDPRGEVVLNAHPRLDLFLSDSSPHPMNDFGCTVCHWGRGQAVEFPRTFHTPSDEYDVAGNLIETREQKSTRWVEDFGYDPARHYWDWPMIPADKSYSACFQCHDSTDRIPGVPEYNHSRALVEELGCYGCHKIQGFEHLRKPGPDLTNLAAKTTSEWAQKWVMAPKGFRPTTRMPHFWNQSNTGARPDVEVFPGVTELRFDTDVPWDNNNDTNVDDYRRRNEIEAKAVVSYLFHQSEEALAAGSFELEPTPARAGDVEAGAELFELRGCLGCHSMESEDWLENAHGPDLSKVGSKVSAAWLYNWILDPTRYFHTTVMPDLRLTEDEAWDITAFLMEQRDPEWEARPAPPGDAAIVERIAREIFVNAASEAWADVEIARLQAQGGEAAVEVYVGQKMFERYGCAGCHLVPDHYEDMGIGTELTQEYLKELSKFDFGHEYTHELADPMDHSRVAWLRAKITEPRVYDRMPVIDDHEVQLYEQKVKAPADKLKMPNYYLTDEETELVLQFLLSTRADGIDSTMKRTLSPEELLVEQGSRLITERNCIGCHKLGQLPVPVSVDADTIEYGRTHGLWTAENWDVEGETILPAGAWLNDEVYNPWEQESYDTEEFLEEHPFVGQLLVYGVDEGAMGHYIEQPAYRPPTFRGQGAKVQPDWVYEFLLNPYIVRTHMEVRMPSFGFDEDEARALAHWFAAQDEQPWPFYLEPSEHAEFDPELANDGFALFNQFGCNQCHPSGEVEPSNPDSSNWGPDLNLSRDRLKTDWVGNWLADPQALSPGTKMPSFFGGYDIEEGPMPDYHLNFLVDDEGYESIYDDWQERIRALQHYLKHMDKVGTGSTN